MKKLYIVTFLMSFLLNQSWGAVGRLSLQSIYSPKVDVTGAEAKSLMAALNITEGEKRTEYSILEKFDILRMGGTAVVKRLGIGPAILSETFDSLHRLEIKCTEKVDMMVRPRRTTHQCSIGGH